jgi:hypothetical protein
MNVTVEDVTPQIAEVWLNQNKTNRTLREGVAEAYAADMSADKWTQCTDPIGFYSDGDLANGQHRLFAVCLSGTTQKFIVVRGLSREDGLNIDTGFMRTLIDNARISGTDDGLSNTLVTAARAIANGSPNGAKRETYAQKLEIIEKYRAPAQFAASHVRRIRFLCSSPVLAAVGRAFMYEADQDRLRYFCTVLATGLYDDKEADSSAIVLRNYLLTKGALASSSAMWPDTFSKAQNAIWYFMHHKKLTTLKATDEETYPLTRTKKRK